VKQLVILLLLILFSENTLAATGMQTDIYIV